jgi:hypothetical protein
MSDFEHRLSTIEQRNQRVETDKAWEISWTRRGSIAAITYICAFILLNILGHDGAWKHALIPVMGYILSTHSLPAVKEIWLNNRSNKLDH